MWRPPCCWWSPSPRGRAGEDPSPAHPGGELPCVLCINKIDTVERKDDLLAVIAAYSEVYPDFDAIIPISARTGDGLEDLLTQMQRYAVEGPQLFPDGMTTDQPDQQVCAEIIREKMLLCLDKEIPHGTAVEVTRFTEREDSGIIDLDVTIYCERPATRASSSASTGICSSASARWPGRISRSSWVPRSIWKRG